MGVDVVTGIKISRSTDAVAGYAADPANAPVWYANIESAEWLTEPPLRAGSQVKFAARFLGRQLDYTYEVAEFIPAERLVMRTAQGPFPMETTYAWEAIDEHSTWMTLRNRGKPTGYFAMAAPLMAGAMRRANRKDLENLRIILEAS